MQNPKLFEDSFYALSDWKVSSFSANNFCTQTERQKLEEKYIGLTEITDKFTRKSVSYQLSKKDNLHRWLKYKEGFSAELVSLLIEEFNIQKGDTLLDPFLGSGTTSLVGMFNGINSLGFDILPMTEIALAVKKSVYDYNVSELRQLENILGQVSIPVDFQGRPDYINITQGAFPADTEKELVYFTEWNEKARYPQEVKSLISLCILNSLERISYSAKDGQYLRWDYRSAKIQDAENKRKERGKKPLSTVFDKGPLPQLKELLMEELSKVIADIQQIQDSSDNTDFSNTKLNYIEGSALFELPKLNAEIINGVITSPPYCNRYDYTRTYALELTYLGKGEDDVKSLRQELLSCTVENKTKIDRLRDLYISLNREADFNKILEIIKSNKTLQEINQALMQRQSNGHINNKGVLRMVDGYFSELSFIYAEIYRISKPGSYVAFVNDNVRYGGEVIPVDFLSTEIAEQIGFTPIKIYSLRQQKGNSSQQMKKYGRVPLRKSITIWRKG